ncbi:MAG: hypothetical protein ACOYN0_10870 [Phycisphaerales bacterium]
MTPQQQPQPILNGRASTNVILAAIAVSLGVIALDAVTSNPFFSRTALAQPAGDEENGRISAAEQRKQIIAELKTLQSKVERLDATIGKGISVKVTELPRQEQAGQ